MKKKNSLVFLITVSVMVVTGMIYIFLRRPNLPKNSTTLTNQSYPNIETVDIISERYMFAPTLVRLKRGRMVRLTLKTVDVQHGIAVSDLKINLEAYPGRPAETIITPDKIGEYTTNCSLYCGENHNKMKITFMVYE